MSRQYLSAVFDADCALEERLNQVAPGAEDADCEAEANPMG